MFLEQTSQKVKGYIIINVYGFFVERFLNLALSKGINLWNIKKTEDVYIVACTNIFEYKKLVAIAKKTGCKINIQKKVGVPFFIVKHKKRKTFFVFAVLISILIYVYGLFVWQIDIVGDFTFPIDQIKEELALENVRIGILKNSLDTSKIKNNIYMRRHDIAWIGINIRGTKAIVEVVEANLKKEEEFANMPCNIVSNKDGIVYKVNALEGTSAVQVGDIVKSGDVLISGIMYSQNAGNRFVNAKGSVLLKTWYTDKIKIPFERDIVSKTGRTNKSYILGFKNYKINLLNSGTKFEKYDTITSENSLRLFGRFEVPINLTTIVYREISIDTIKYTKDQAMIIATNEIENSIKNRLDKNIEIIDKRVKTNITSDGITVEITLECLEETGVKQKLEGY